MKNKYLYKLSFQIISLFALNCLMHAQVQEPYKTHTIPGKIEAEYFDKGGEGISYHDENAGSQSGGCSLRPPTDTLSDNSTYVHDVDVEPNGDGDGTCNIGFVEDEEWLEYTIDTIIPGKYQIIARVARPGNGGGAAVFYLDGEMIGVSRS